VLSNNFLLKKVLYISGLGFLVVTLSSPVMAMRDSEDDSPKAVSKKNSQKSVPFYEHLMEKGQYDYALELLKSAYKCGELDVDATLFYADMLAEEDDLQEAISVFKKLADQDIPYAIKRLEELEEEDLENVLRDKKKKIQGKVWEEE